MELTEAQKKQYAEQGYVLLPGLFDGAELARFEQRFLHWVQQTAATDSAATPLPAGMKLMRDVMVVKGVVNPAASELGINKLLSFEQDDELFAYAQHPGLLQAVASMVGVAPYVIASNVFNKPPEVDGRHPFHQDLKYFRLRPADRIVGTWTAISPSTRANGCLAVLPGSHRGELLPHQSPDWEHVNHAFLGVDVDAPQERLHVEMAPGDTLLFHPLLVHGSGHNTTADCRRAISVHFAGAELLSDQSATRVRRAYAADRSDSIG